MLRNPKQPPSVKNPTSDKLVREEVSEHAKMRDMNKRPEKGDKIRKGARRRAG